MTKYGLLILMMLLSLTLAANDGDIHFSGNYKDVSFEDFVRDLEQKTDVKFRYRPEWVEGITISASGTNLSLSEILEKSFSGTKTFFYIDEDHNVFITRGVRLITELPEYNDETARIKSVTGEEKSEVTSAEQSYKEGRKNGPSETIVIGSVSPGSNQKTAIVNGKVSDKETGEDLIGKAEEL